MEQSLKDLCEPHLWAIAIVLLVLILMGPLLYGAGVLLKPLIGKAINAGLKRLSGESTEVNVNLGNAGTQEMSRHSDEMGEIMAKDKQSCIGCPGLIDPTKCPMHEAERERSLRNEKSIKELWDHFGNLQNELKKEIGEIKELAAANNATIIANQKALMDAIKGIPRRRQ